MTDTHIDPFPFDDGMQPDTVDHPVPDQAPALGEGRRHDAAPAPSSRRRGLGRRVWGVVRPVVIACLVVQVVVAVLLVALNWWTPSTSAFMLENSGAVVHQTVSIDHISRYVLADTIVHEDARLGPRVWAVDLSDLLDRAQAHADGKSDPSNSTIPQQLTKNLFLYPDQTVFRKGVEFVLATELVLALSDQRVLELYLNIAQFGPRLYGICAATWYYFNSPPWDVTEYQAAQLMGVLPSPDDIRRAPGGGIDVGPTVDQDAAGYVLGEANVHVPAELAIAGGWRAAVGTVGISDTASDHAQDRGSSNACSTMPDSVAQLIAETGGA